MITWLPWSFCTWSHRSFFLGQLSGELIVLPVIPAHINGVAVCGDEAHGLGGGLLHLPPASLQPEVTAGGQLLPDFLQLALRLRPVQLLQDAEEVLQLLAPQLQLAGQLLLPVLGLGVVLVVLGRVLLRGQEGGTGEFGWASSPDRRSFPP